MEVVILWQIGAFNNWHGGNNVNSLAILIPTRNRPIAIDRILESISRSTLKPEQVIVVSSGQDIGSVIKNYSKENILIFGGVGIMHHLELQMKCLH